MESSGAVLLTVMCVLFSRISGAEVKMRVRRGDNITLYCDYIISLRSEIAWFRNCSDENHPPLVLTSSSNFKHHFPRFGLVRNSSSKSYDLLIENVTEKDLGLYYCARQEKKVTSEEKSLKRERTVYRYGNLTTRIILRDTTFPCPECPQTTPAPDCSICWKLLLSVGGDDVCYASLDLPSRGQKRLKKKRVECSEFSTYSEVKTDKL
ncbi:hypothetical protein MHYP_G00250180 [Metynnis hypsauchen]